MWQGVWKELPALSLIMLNKEKDDNVVNPLAKVFFLSCPLVFSMSQAF
jgi:hypothetical protein